MIHDNTHGLIRWRKPCNFVRWCEPWILWMRSFSQPLAGVATISIKKRHIKLKPSNR